MLNGLIIDDEELRARLLLYYDKLDLIELLNLSGQDILDAFWDRVQEDPDVFIDVLTDLDFLDLETGYEDIET